MSYSGKFTSLELNVLNGLMNNRGLRINPQAIQNYGLWKPDSNVQGNVVNNTVLNKITYAIGQALDNCVPTKLPVTVWRKLLKIGEGVCPALANARSNKFLPTYPGYGSWDYRSVNEFGDVSSSTELNLVEKIYPPKNYGKEKTYSYVYQEHGDYAWITGWPGRNSWQKSTDDFAAAYEPSTTENTVTDYDRYFKQGFLSTVARQAYYEFWSSFDSRRPNQYREFINFFQNGYQWKNNTNVLVSSFTNTKTFNKGTFSGINDLTTSDIAGVNLAFKTFGSELIRLGKSLDLSQIHLFGLPSKFLLTIQKNNALSDPLKYALLLSDLTTIELEDILSPTFTPSNQQERKIFNALQLIQGQDLSEITLILNCATPGLTALSDLIDPKKMFPSSYRSLTIPEFSVDTPSYKNYDLIYNGDSVNPLIRNWGTYLQGILPEYLIRACGAFMMTMNQVKNIRQMETEKLAQIIVNLESTNKDLPLVNSTDSTPGDVASANEALSTIAFGTGNSNTYKFTDMLGAMSGIPYNDIATKLEIKIDSIPTTNLSNIYDKIYQKSLGNDWELLGHNNTNNSIKVYKITKGQSSGAMTVEVTNQIAEVLNVGDKIKFNESLVLADPSSTTEYEVVGIEDDVLQLDKPLTHDVFFDYKIFVFNDEYEEVFNNLINSANQVISTYKTDYGSVVEEINGLWDKINTQLAAEQRSAALCMRQSLSITESATNSEIEQFVRNIANYAKETDYGEVANILENIADISNLTGQSIIAAMRESRNAARLLNGGGELDNDIPDTLTINGASANLVVENGKIVDVIITSRGYNYPAAPEILVAPQGGVFGGSGNDGLLQAILDDNGSIAKINIINPGFGYDDNNPPDLIIAEPPGPVRDGGPLVPGSFAGSPYTDQDPVPDELVTDPETSFTVDEAIEEVNRCKCNC